MPADPSIWHNVLTALIFSAIGLVIYVGGLML